ncbi:MAG: HEAT repeat domain-containing protein [Parachlamydiaceae bacterium]
MYLEKLIDIRFLVVVILILEFFLLIILTYALIFRRFWVKYRDQRNEKIKEKISFMIIQCLKEKKLFVDKTELKKFCFNPNFLSVIEQFDRRLRGGDWEELKRSIAENCLMKRAQRWTKSRSWIKRNFSARCFALSPRKEYEQEILLLIDDPVFLVRSFAAVAAVDIRSQKGVAKIITQMSHTTGYSYSFYRDIILQSKSKDVFECVEDLAANNNNENITLACLDVLSGISKVITLPFLRNDLMSSNEAVRVAAVKVFAHNPQVDSPTVLSKCANDLNENIRALALWGLEYFASEESLKQLSQALSDSSWIVRSQAAKSLKKMGGLGLNVLEKQNPEKNRPAYEAAQYALNFDW